MMEWFDYVFFQRALLACIFGGAGLSLIGVFLVLMDIPFLGISMAHSAFLGAIFGLLFGFNPLVGAMGVSAISGAAIGPIADRSGSSSNTVLAILFSATMGVGFLCISLIPGPKTEALNLIWGSVLTVSKEEIIILAALCVVVIGVTIGFYKEIQAVLFHREIAAVSGVPEKWFYYGILFAASLIISASLDMVGGMLIFSLLVNPAGAARLLTHRLKHLFICAVLFGIASCLIGLMMSCWLNIPTGAVIVLVSTGIYIIAHVTQRFINKADV